MELLVGNLLFIATITAVLAIDEFINWMNDYDRAGADDREFQRRRQDQSYGIEYRE